VSTISIVEVQISASIGKKRLKARKTFSAAELEAQRLAGIAVETIGWNTLD